MRSVKYTLYLRFTLGLLIPMTGPLNAQTGGGEDDLSQAEVFELSPFEVSTTGDKGYYASNTISGSRISVPIQDIPLTIEVVTSEFIEDTGATDLRDSLRYSAGILLESQNDAFGNVSEGIGNVNNPEGSTGDKGESSFKIRGFVLENTLRNGFRRQNATDTVNIDRIEVIRGPSALLYGVGNFGGVVNYLTKSPLPYRQQELGLTIGSDNQRRLTLDSTGPLLGENLGYRLSFAYEDRDDWTDLNTREHFFISPVVEWRPMERIKLTADFEYGKANEDAISFKSVRTPSLDDVNIFQSDRLETFGFLEFSEDKNANLILDPGEDLNDNGQIDLTRDPRTYRWSGPDTFLDTESWNTSVSMEVKLAENVYYKGGINVSNVKFDSRDVFGGISINDSDRAKAILADMAAGAEDTNGNGVLDPGEDLNGNGVLDFGRGILARQIIDGSASDVQIPVFGKVFQYNWTGAGEETDWFQVRHELTFSRRIFEGKKWLESEHNFLLGYSKETQEFEVTGFVNKDSPDDENFYFKDPTDESYIRFGPDENGFEIPFEANRIDGNTSENIGKYLVYSGRFLNDRLFLVAGMREDKTTNRDGYYENIGSREGRVFYDELDNDGDGFPDGPTTVRKRTTQFGVSLEVIEGFTLFALKSEGVEPNFDGQRDGWGNALESTVADATEFGIKFNYFNGRVAGTISKFNIKREGLPFRYWWAPAPVVRPDPGDLTVPGFRRNDPIIYRLDDYNARKKAGPQLLPENRNPYHEAAFDEWLAAETAVRPTEIIVDLDADGNPVTETVQNPVFEIDGITYLNASTPEGAAYLDAVFNALKAAFEVPFDDPNKDLDPWAGFLYEGINDPIVNSAWESRSDQGYYQTISDESDGIEAQLIFTPIDNLQIILNYSHVEREVISPGDFVEFDYAEGNWDRWATWYYPNINWGLAGVPTDQVYPGGPGGNLPNRDTSTWTGIGWGKGEALDDTPEDVVSWWASYSFTGDTPLDGLQIGFGGQWESKREFASAFTSAGQKKQNETGTTIKAYTDERWTLNAMAKYKWRMRDRYDAYIQINVDNFLDDTDQYGFFYAPGISWKFNMGITF